MNQGAVPGQTAPRRAARRETGFPRQVKLLVRKRAGDGDPNDAQCEACPAWLGPDGGEIQHIVARGMGGTSLAVKNSAANAALLCYRCHRLAESRDPEMRAKGFWLPQGSDPRLEPMMLFSAYGSGVLVWRSEDGGYLLAAPEGLAA
jgi:hypothetical protein